MSEINYEIGKISEKKIKTGSTNNKDWKMAIFTLDSGLKASTFNADIIDAYNQGDTVKMAYEIDGKFNKLLGFEDPTADELKRKELTPASNMPESQGKPDNAFWLAKEKRIIRQNCNQRAIEAVGLIWDKKPEIIESSLEANNGDMQKVFDAMAAHFEEIVWRDQ